MTTTNVPATAPVQVEDLDRLLVAVSGDRMAATVATLAGDGFAGRRVGSAGGAAARAWLGQRLADLGAAVAFEPFPVPAIGIGAGMAGYHSPADIPDRVDPATMTALARLVVATVWFAATRGATLSSLIGDRR